MMTSRMLLKLLHLRWSVTKQKNNDWWKLFQKSFIMIRYIDKLETNQEKEKRTQISNYATIIYKNEQNKKMK